MGKHKQPAKPSYFFHGGFVDLGNVIAGAFEKCGEIIVDSLGGIADTWNWVREAEGFWAKLFISLLGILKFGFFFARLIFSAIVTPLICFSITMFQVAILLALFSVASIFFGIIILLDRIYCTIHLIVSHCPNCQHKFSIPVYICPKCKTEHDRLRPGFYGILSRRCTCGKQLPTTFFNGRQKLEARCPHCNCDIKDGGLHASWCIPVVGGPSSGKTCYITMTMMSLGKTAPKYGLKFEYEKNDRDEYENNANLLSRGKVPYKTADDRLNYYQFSLTPSGATRQQISLCDVAGELFDATASNAINTQIGFRYANAFILLIDPLSISAYRNEVSKKTGLAEYKGSMQPIDKMLDTFIRTLQNMFSIKANTMLDTDVAVVFTKADIPGLDEKIGESAVLKKAPGLNQKARYAAQNKLCEQFLRDYNEENFLNSLKSRFKSIQFFTCSALGHIENGQPFIAKNVEEPFFWLARKKSKVIDRAIKSGGNK
jgi:hypothetical protein